MRRRVTAALAVVLTATAVLVTASPAQVPGTETIVVQEGFGHVKWIQNSRPERISAGDVQLAQSAVDNPGTTDRVGTNRYDCTVHFGSLANSRYMLCMNQLVIFGRGTIQADGIIHLGKAPDKLAVVGGTGDFVDVGGRMTRTGSPGSPIITVSLVYH